MATQGQQRRFEPFASFGEFALAVRRAAETRNPDPRLFYAAAPATQSQEGVGADGGYLVPPDIRGDVSQVLLGETSLLGRTDLARTRSNSVSIPADAAPAWLNLQPTLEPEGALLGQVKLVLQGRTVRLTKLQVSVPTSGELFEDALGLEAYLRQATAARLDFRVTDYLINGDGVMKPLGILNSPALITQAKEAAQAAGTIVYANVMKMWARLWGPAKSRAAWLAHSSAEQALQGMAVPAGVLTYPADSLYGFLFGRPILVTEAAQVVGTPGDILLVDPKGIFAAVREPGVREDISLHCYFDLDLSSFRFTLRVGAEPWWAAAVSQLRGGATVSSAVALEAR